MSKKSVRGYVVEKMKSSPTEKEKSSNGFLSKNLKKVYRIGLHKSCSPLSLSSLSLSLSQSYIDSFNYANPSSLAQKITLALHLISSQQRREVPVAKNVQQSGVRYNEPGTIPSEEGLNRCNWISKSSGKLKTNFYVQFHDECWGAPAYDDNQLFELLAMSGMLMDYNWTDILKRREFFREAFTCFYPNLVAKMGENEIMEISSHKAIMLAESRMHYRQCQMHSEVEYGSFSGYIWGYVNYKPIVNRYRHPRNVPLRSPKAEAISKDLLKRGFLFVGPVIVYSFMQAAGLTIDHLVHCFRYRECVNVAERPWRHV